MSIVTQEDLRRSSGGPYVSKGVLYEHGNQRQLQAHEVADAEKYANDYWGRGNVPPPRTTSQYNPASKTYQQVQAEIANQRRDQWSGSQSTQGGNFGNVEGFDANNWNDPNMQTAKYQAGRIFSNYDPNNRDVLQAILSDAQFRAQFPNAKGVGPDKIDFGDGRPVDVIRGHGAPGAKFSWQTEDSGASNAGGSNIRAAIVGVPNSYTSGTMPVSQPTQQVDEMELYYQYLQSIINGQQESI